MGDICKLTVFASWDFTKRSQGCMLTSFSVRFFGKVLNLAIPSNPASLKRSSNAPVTCAKQLFDLDASAEKRCIKHSAFITQSLRPGYK